MGCVLVLPKVTSWFSAATSCVARLGGWSLVELVSMVITTKPCEASFGPHQLMLDWVAR